MDTITAGFVDGIGAAAATSGVLSQLQGRIFALLYLTPEQLSLDQIADELHRARATSPSISAGWNGIWSGALASSAPARTITKRPPTSGS